MVLCDCKLVTFEKNFSKMPGCGAGEVLAGSFKFSRSCFFRASTAFRDLGNGCLIGFTVSTSLQLRLTKFCRADSNLDGGSSL